MGKTSVAAGLIARLPERNWTAIKITQFGHGICSAHGDPCDCAVDDEEHSWAVNEERSRKGESDTSRFLIAGAAHSFWVRTRQGRLAEAMPRVRQLLAGSENAMIESNSVIGFIRPELYLTVLDHATADFKDSARLFLDRADALLLHRDSAALPPNWKGVPQALLNDKPVFHITHQQYVTDEVLEFVRKRLDSAASAITQPALEGR